MSEAIDSHGFLLLDNVFETDQVASWQVAIDAALNDSQTGTLSSRDRIYGARNILETWPTARTIPQFPMLAKFVRHVLGKDAGLVRTLYFDKPPGRSWSLPWHRDLTIAVRNHQPDTGEYRCPTTKAGIPHVEAPRWLLQRMLTLRVHLDPMTDENGPLVVIGGSHVSNDPADVSAESNMTTIHCPAGGVLAMRPLISHSSIHAKPENTLRRRILHYEFAGVPTLTDGYEWRTFERLNA